MLWILAVGCTGVMVCHAQTLRTIVEFGAVTGRTNASTGYPTGLTQSSDGTLYGTTAALYAGHGTVFKVQPDGGGFAVLKWFTNAVEGTAPRGGLVLSEGTLYGTTTNGGSGTNGTIFKLETDGSGYTVLKSFTSFDQRWSETNWDGARPFGHLALSNNTLYGTTSSGGHSGVGTVFKVNTDGTDFTVLKQCTREEAARPYAGLVLSGNTLYGTSVMGGSGWGSVFSLNADGTDFTVLKQCTLEEAARPSAGLVLSGRTLYGTGGISGSIFKLKTDGTDFAVLHDFGPGERRTALGSVVSGNTLYGTMSNGGIAGLGTVFRLNVDGTGYTEIAHFTGGSGAYPGSGMVLSGRTLYGTTSAGGQGDKGTVFKIDLVGLPLVIRAVEGAVVLKWGRSADVLQAAGDAAGTYTNVPGAASPYINAPVMPRQFFRLIGP